MKTLVNSDYCWSVTYGGDEPMSHSFYRRILNAVMQAAISEEIELEITTHVDAAPLRCMVLYAQGHNDHIVVRDVHNKKVHAIMVDDIQNIHIC